MVVVKVRGEIDLYTGPALRQTLQDLLPPVTTPRRAGQGVGGAASGGAGDPGPAQVRAVVVDLTEVTFVDSYALGVLVHGHRLARPGDRAYAVVATLPMLRKLFEVTGLGRVLPLHPGVASALSGLHPAREDARG
ncbi:STAS domain-containing protein [Streptomyces sp. NP160]|nr:STAS domain-containing protein [Streptomyces sp. NP160]